MAGKFMIQTGLYIKYVSCVCGRAYHPTGEAVLSSFEYLIKHGRKKGDGAALIGWCRPEVKGPHDAFPNLIP